MSGTVVVTYPGFDPDDPRSAGLLRAAGLDARREPRTGERAAVDVARLMRGAVAGIVSTDPFDETVFAACPDLRVLARVGVGTDSIDLEAATRAGVAVTITANVHAASVADHTVALMLACTRRLLENDRAVRAGEWDRGGRLIAGELTGATVGIVGLGGTGRAVARRLAGFDVELLACDVAPVAAPGVEQVAFDELLARSQVVTLHVPLLPSTRGLVGARELRLMRRDAILVNTSRGAIVDERALADALREGRPAGAGLDVFAHEPPSGSPLLALPNVVLSPHVGGISSRSQPSMLEQAAASIVAVLEDRAPAGLVNPAALGARAEVA